MNSDKTMPSPSERHYPALDGLRGMAALMIVWHHFMLFSPVHEFWLSHIGRFSGFAWIGVDLFFVLSGFLITGILVDSKFENRYFRNFYAKRVLRIFPLYYGILVVVLLILPALNIPTGLSPASHIFFWTYTGNFYVAKNPGFGNYLSPLWSLSIEEQFYIVWPLIIFFTRRIERLRTGLLIAFLSVTVLRCILYFSGVSFGVIYLSTETHCDALILGGYLALSIRSQVPGALKALRPNKLLAAGIIAIVYFLSNFDGFGGRFEGLSIVHFGRSVVLFALLAVIFVWMVHAATNSKPSLISRLFSHPVLRWFGKYSYALYVLHFPIALLILQVGMSGLSTMPILAEFELFFLYFGVCITAAFLSWHLYEKHFVKLKRYFRPGEKLADHGVQVILELPT